ncbi:MAG TPA: hypothetical protein VGG10_18590 [Rhizomicrobium sp.]|jgi:hypothetical protein
MLQGIKTYLVAAAMLAYVAIDALVMHRMSTSDDMQTVFAALALCGMRSALTTEAAKLLAGLGINPPGSKTPPQGS